MMTENEYQKLFEENKTLNYQSQSQNANLLLLQQQQKQREFKALKRQ